MELTVTLDNEARIDTIIRDLDVGRKSRPEDHVREMTGYWKHHLSKIHIEKVDSSRVTVSGESGFYFPGMTYSGLDLLNTLYKRFGLLRWIRGTRFDISIPQNRHQKFGYKIGGKFISSDFLRSIHHADNIITRAEKAGVMLPESPKVLEIGSGTGIQALVFNLLFKKSVYYLVDFPETLALASVFLSAVVPNKKILFFDEWQSNPELLTSNEYDFVLVPNYAIAQIPSDVVHVAINTVSMQEMNYSTIGMYFTQLRRILKSPALFYQCNRDKKMDGILIELAQYPYMDSDMHIYKEKDAFCKNSIFMRKCFGRFPLLCHIQIPIIKSGTQCSYLTVMAKK